MRTSLRALAEERIGRTDAAVVGTRLFDEALADARWPRRGARRRPSLSLRGVVTEPSSGRRASPVDVWGVDERFWAFHGIGCAGARRARRAREPRPGGGARGDAGRVAAAARRGRRTTSPGARSSAAGTTRASAAAKRRGRSGRRATSASSRCGRARSRRARSSCRSPTLQAGFGGAGRVNLVLSRGGGATALADASLAPRRRARGPGSAAARDRAGPGVVARERRARSSTTPWSGRARGGADAARGERVARLPRQRAARRDALGALLARRGRRRARQRSARRSAAPGRRRLRTPRHPPQRLGGTRARAPRGRPRSCSTTTSGSRRPARDAPRAVPRRGDRADRRARGRSRARAGLPGHHARDAPRRLGPAVPRGPVAHPAAGRGLLAALPHDTEGVGAARRGPGALGTPARAHTSLRLAAANAPHAAAIAAPSAFAAALVERLAPAPRAACVVDDVRARALAAARGATDFGQYFVYFSFFLVVAALLLAGLFFRFGLEQRLARAGPAAGRRLHRGAPAARCSSPRPGAGAVLGALLGMGGAVALRVADDARPAHALGGCRRHARAHARTSGRSSSGWAPGRRSRRRLSRSPSTLRGLRGRSVRSLLAGAPQEWGPPRGRSAGLGDRSPVLAAFLLVHGAASEARRDIARLLRRGRRSSARCALFVSARLSGERQRAAAGATGTGRGTRLPAGVPPRPGRSVLCDRARRARLPSWSSSVGASRHEGPPGLRLPPSPRRAALCAPRSFGCFRSTTTPDTASRGLRGAGASTASRSSLGCASPASACQPG